jgi:hypothetical protein
MAAYNVQQNPYYQPPTGRNWIADRIIAAMQSFSAPKGPEMLPPGVSGPNPTNALPRKPAGFFGALGGNDNNRINQAELLRQADVNAGRVPFEAEVGAQEKLQGNEFGFKQKQDDAFLAQRRAEDDARRQNALTIAQEAQQGLDRRQVEALNSRTQEEALRRAYDMTQSSRRFQQDKELRQITAPMSEYQRAMLRRPQAVGGTGVFLPDQNQLISMGRRGEGAPNEIMQLPPSSGIEMDELNWLNGTEEANPNAINDATQQMTDIEELLKPPGVPSGISY